MRASFCPEGTSANHILDQSERWVDRGCGAGGESQRRNTDMLMISGSLKIRAFGAPVAHLEKKIRSAPVCAPVPSSNSSTTSPRASPWPPRLPSLPSSLPVRRASKQAQEYKILAPCALKEVSHLHVLDVCCCCCVARGSEAYKIRSKNRANRESKIVDFKQIAPLRAIERRQPNGDSRNHAIRQAASERQALQESLAFLPVCGRSSSSLPPEDDAPEHVCGFLEFKDAASAAACRGVAIPFSPRRRGS